MIGHWSERIALPDPLHRRYIHNMCLTTDFSPPPPHLTVLVPAPIPPYCVKTLKWSRTPPSLRYWIFASSPQLAKTTQRKSVDSPARLQNIYIQLVHLRRRRRPSSKKVKTSYSSSTHTTPRLLQHVFCFDSSFIAQPLHYFSELRHLPFFPFALLPYLFNRTKTFIKASQDARVVSKSRQPCL